MGLSIFGRGETAANYYKRDTYLLYKMLSIKHLGYVLPDLEAQMFRHIDHVANIQTVGGQISIGGLVTRLAIHLGVLPSEGLIYRVAPVPVPKTIDIGYLMRGG